MKIRYLPDQILRKKSLDVLSVDHSLKNDITKMLDIMYKSSGIGLSAVQVGILKRFFIIDISKNNIEDSNYNALVTEDNIKVTYPLIIINPVIHYPSQVKEMFSEGCLSIPGIHVSVPRYKKIELEFLNLEMNKQKISCSGLLARVIQHEYDHLNGKLIIDYLSYIKKHLVIKKFYKNFVHNT